MKAQAGKTGKGGSMRSITERGSAAVSKAKASKAKASKPKRTLKGLEGNKVGYRVTKKK